MKRGGGRGSAAKAISPPPRFSNGKFFYHRRSIFIFYCADHHKKAARFSIPLRIHVANFQGGKMTGESENYGLNSDLDTINFNF